MRTTAARTHSNSAPTKIPSDTTFLEEAGIFSYRRIGREERLGYPVATFRGFDLFVNRMANRKASCEDKMPADLFKRALKSFRKRAMIISNLILAGYYKCKPLDLGPVMQFQIRSSSVYRPIALRNAFYQLVNIIVTSRLRGLVEKYSVLESSQFGFRNSRAVQLII